jgi:hypothetical protein
MGRTYPIPESRWAACGHAHCTDCRTKRGRNRGNRRARQAIRRLLRKEN